jgi:hypothetical protein
VTWIVGAIALSALVACVVMPVIVYFSESAEYSAKLESFQRWLLVPTLIYFAAAIVWRVGRMRRQE